MDYRICGNGHVFDDSLSTCPDCGSVASRPATTQERRLAGAGTSGAELTRVVQAEDRLVGLLVWGVGLMILGGLLSLAAAESGSLFFVVTGFLASVIGAVFFLVAVIGFGVREGIKAYVAGQSRADAPAGTSSGAGGTEGTEGAVGGVTADARPPS